LKFFQKNLIPKLHKTLVTSVRQDSSAPLFNLIFAMRIALLQDKISSKENTYFFKQLLLLKDFQDWRKTELDFVNMESEIPRTRLLQIKRDVSRLYPEFGKKFHDLVKRRHDVIMKLQLLCFQTTMEKDKDKHKFMHDHVLEMDRIHIELDKHVKKMASLFGVAELV